MLSPSLLSFLVGANKSISKLKRSHQKGAGDVSGVSWEGLDGSYAKEASKMALMIEALSSLYIVFVFLLRNLLQFERKPGGVWM